NELTPQEMGMLEQHLNEDAAAAMRFRDAIPPAEGTLVAQATGPTPAEWDAIWQRIESAGAGRGGGEAARGTSIRVFPIYRSLTAVAACVALLLIWRFGPILTKVTPAQSGWDLQLSASNQILELAMSGNEAPAVHYDNDGIAVIDYHDVES